MSAMLDFIRTFDGNNARNFLDAYPDYPVYATVLYLAAVFYLPGFLEKRNLRFALKWPVALWNLFLSLVSTVGAFYCIRLVYDYLFISRDFYTAVCEMIQTPEMDKLTLFAKKLHGHRWTEERPTHKHYGNDNQQTELVDVFWQKYCVGPTSFFIAAFVYLKTPELLDTVFLILQGKPVSFLHWFHHIATAIFCWHGAYVLIPTGVFFVTMNYFVHSIMYFYYFLVVLGFRKTIRPFAPVITLLQCTQMFIGMYITSYTYFQYYVEPAKQGTWFYTLWKPIFTGVSYLQAEALSLYKDHHLLSVSELPEFKMEEHFIGCDTDTTNLRMGVMMYGSYCVLFGVLFKELYLDKRVNKTSLVLKRTNGEDSTAPVSPQIGATRANGKARLEKEKDTSKLTIPSDKRGKTRRNEIKRNERSDEDKKKAG